MNATDTIEHNTAYTLMKTHPETDVQDEQETLGNLWSTTSNHFDLNMRSLPTK